MLNITIYTESAINFKFCLKNHLLNKRNERDKQNFTKFDLYFKAHTLYQINISSKCSE